MFGFWMSRITYFSEDQGREVVRKLRENRIPESTTQMDWSKLELVVFASGTAKASGLVCLPDDNVLLRLSLMKRGNTYSIENDPLRGKVSWKIKEFPK